ncbi:MAG: PAS domain S-box protein [Geovibrio sp.]|nr:PAS domain S-box protein [Geovibrio sp.]
MTFLNSGRTPAGGSAPDYGQIFRHANACMLTFDPETTRITDANEAACRLYGYSFDELTSRRILDLTTSKPERTLRLIEQVLKNSVDTVTTCHRDSSGRLHHLEFHSSVFIADGKPYVFNIFHDITEKTLSEIDNRLHAGLMNSFLMNDEIGIFKEILEVIRKEIKCLHGFAGYIDIDGTLVCPHSFSLKQEKPPPPSPERHGAASGARLSVKEELLLRMKCLHTRRSHWLQQLYCRPCCSQKSSSRRNCSCRKRGRIQRT